MDAKLGGARQCDEPFRHGVISPRSGTDRVRDHSRCEAVCAGGCEQPGVTQLAREVAVGCLCVSGYQAMKAPADIVDDVEFAVVVRPKADDLQGGVDQFPGLGQAASVVASGPDFSGHVITVNVGPGQGLQASAGVHLATGDRAGFGVRVCDGRWRDGCGASIPFGMHRL